MFVFVSFIPTGARIFGFFAPVRSGVMLLHS